MSTDLLPSQQSSFRADVAGREHHSPLPRSPVVRNGSDGRIGRERRPSCSLVSAHEHLNARVSNAFAGRTLAAISAV